MRPNRFAVLATLAVAATFVVQAASAAKSAPAGKAATSQEGALELVYGDDHAFGVVPPHGWVLDDTSGLGSKIRVVLYPRGQKWATAPVVMYSNPLHQDRLAPRSFAQMLERDAADFLKNSPRGKVVPAPNLPAAGHREAVVRYFAPDGGAPRTAVAYIPEKDLVMLLVLDAKTNTGFQGALPAFRDLVGSYQFVAANVRTPTRPGVVKKP